MKALVLSKLGRSARLEPVVLPLPAPKGGEVRIRVRAAALNPLDAKIATGAMSGWFPVTLPYVPGTDFAGSVEALGKGVTDLAIGDEVFGRADPTQGGALAEAIVLSTSLVAHRPLHVAPSEAACLPTPAGIAWQVLAPALASSAPGVILVLGDGAVARAAMESGGQDVRELASVAELDGLTEPVCLFDIAGGDMRDQALRRLPTGSHVVSIASPIDGTITAAKELHADFAVLRTERDQLEVLARLAADGVLTPRIDHFVALPKLPEVFEQYVARRITGKIVIQGE